MHQERKKINSYLSEIHSSSLSKRGLVGEFERLWCGYLVRLVYGQMIALQNDLLADN